MDQQKITVISHYNKSAYQQALQNLFNQCSQSAHDFVERADYFSSQFLNRPYLTGALGEGEQGLYDQSPLYRNDYFDCVTYLNTVLALSLATSFAEFESNMLWLNYEPSQACYQFRHHFMSVDWNYQNQQKHLVKDITQQLVDQQNQSVVEIAQTVIDRPNWFLKKQLKDIKRMQPLSTKDSQDLLLSLRAFAEKVRPQQSHLPYLPIKLILGDELIQEQLQQKLPQITVVEIVRPNWDLRQQIGTHLNVSHVGFLFKQKQQLIFRHASQLAAKVVEQDFFAYLAGYKDSPTVKGINFQKIQPSVELINH